MDIRSTALSLAATACFITTGHAGGLEDTWRKFIDGTKASGKPAPEVPLSRAAAQITAKPSTAPRTDQLPLGREQYAIFVAPNCRSCETAIQRLKAKGYKVEVLDVSRSATAREAFGLVGAKGVPSVLVGRYLMTGWSDKLFDQTLGREFNDKSQRGEGA